MLLSQCSCHTHRPPGNNAGYAPPVGTGAATEGNETHSSHTTKIITHDLHPVWYSDAADGRSLTKVQKFLGQLEWDREEDLRGGITWLELFIYYSINTESEEEAIMQQPEKNPEATGTLQKGGEENLKTHCP